MENTSCQVDPSIRGRFAPTPSGDLHFGSLVTAIGSWLHARNQGGSWLLRIDDLDPPRVRPGSIDSILRTLEGFGLEWSGSVRFQSRHTDAYAAMLARLLETGRCYRCTCSRKDVATDSRIGPDGPVYPGTCRTAGHTASDPGAWRLNTAGAVASFTDAILGPISCNVGDELGDFIVQRSDRLFAYHLASVVDDHAMGITEVLRGGDLVPSTLRQVLLCDVLGMTPPRFGHLPVLVDAEGRKLSKSSGALGVDPRTRSETWLEALKVLGQEPPESLATESLPTIRDWAVAHWRLDSVPKGFVLAPERHRVRGT